ncbi:hypothetical protein [Aquabacterium olei]|nr:hypothetical protein [Aquabacterium olei]
MTQVWKVAGMWLVIAAVIWLFSIWQWQTTDATVADRDIVMQLLVLPVMLTVALWLTLRGVQRLRKSPAPAADRAAPTVSLDEQPGSEAALRAATTWLLASAVSLRAGSDADAAWATLQSNPPRPGPDATLFDLDGMPVFAARVEQVDELLASEPDAVLSHPDGRAASVAVQRAWVLMQSVLPPLLDAVSRLIPDETHGGSSREPEDDAAAPSMRAHLSGVAAPVSAQHLAIQEARRPTLTVRLALPARWSVEDQALFVQALRGQCGVLLDWAEATHARALRWQTTPPESVDAVWHEVDQTLARWHRDPAPELLLMLAVDSAIDADEIDGLQARGELFTAHHQQGRIPGEGAAGLLLASPMWPQPGALDVPAILLGRPLLARRDKSADAVGRASTATLQALLEAAATRSPAPADAPPVVVADADHRGSRAAELFESVQDALPAVDAATGVVRLGEVCGDLGAARGVATIALAHAALRQQASPDATTYAVLMQDSHERVVVPLRHAPPPVTSDANADAPPLSAPATA